MKQFKLLLLVLLLYIPMYSKSISSTQLSKYIKQDIQRYVKGENRPSITSIYKRANYRPLWVNRKRRMNQLIHALNNPLFNYKKKSFNQSAITQLFYQLDSGEIASHKKAAVYARIDLMFTDAFVRLVRFVKQGDVDWQLVKKKLKALKQDEDIKANWEIKPKAFPPLSRVASVALHGNIERYLHSLIPMKKRYHSLIKMLKNYRMMDKFPEISYTYKPLRRGNASTRIKMIKRRLQISGDYPKHAPINENFDLALEKAVKTYQKRYLLSVTGEIDKTMIYYLNQPVSHHIQSIITNLDKTKIYPRSFEREHIEVNIPDFNLRYYRQGKKIAKMGLVVGRIDRPTPLFSHRVEYLVLNPTWTIPDNLVKRDLIHVLRKNPHYMKEHNIHVFSGNRRIEVTQAMLDPYEKSQKPIPYRFVQFPGQDNALGKVKFMFPNRYAVYLHDTDNKSLFSRRYKIHSSGCMRVEKPFALMDLLLRHSRGHYTKRKINHILNTNKPTTIRLKRHIPVHMLYFTAYEEAGLAYFKNDIYLYDKIIQESIKGSSKATFSMPEKRIISIKKALPSTN